MLMLFVSSSSNDWATLSIFLPSPFHFEPDPALAKYRRDVITNPRHMDLFTRHRDSRLCFQIILKGTLLTIFPLNLIAPLPTDYVMIFLPNIDGGHAQSSIDARNYSSLAALVVLTLDHLIVCRSEYRYIWESKFRLPKTLYVISRYLALALQVVNYVFVQKYMLHGPVSTRQCRVWFSLLGTGSIILGICMNLILLLRLYALYMKNSKILALAVPLVGEHMISFIVIGRAVLQDNAFSDRCDLYRTPIEALPLGIITIMSQTALWLAAFKKRKISQAAVLSLVVRESHLTLGIFGILAVVMIPYSFATQSANPFVIFVWPITLISMTSCRLVLNMHELKYEGSPGDSVTEFILTTIFSSTQSSCHSAITSTSCGLPPMSIDTTPNNSSYELSPRLECS